MKPYIDEGVVEVVDWHWPSSSLMQQEAEEKSCVPVCHPLLLILLLPLLHCHSSTPGGHTALQNVLTDFILHPKLGRDCAFATFVSHASTF